MSGTKLVPNDLHPFHQLQRVINWESPVAQRSAPRALSEGPTPSPDEIIIHVDPMEVLEVLEEPQRIFRSFVVFSELRNGESYSIRGSINPSVRAREATANPSHGRGQESGGEATVYWHLAIGRLCKYHDRNTEQLYDPPATDDVEQWWEKKLDLLQIAALVTATGAGMAFRRIEAIHTAFQNCQLGILGYTDAEQPPTINLSIHVSETWRINIPLDAVPTTSFSCLEMVRMMIPEHDERIAINDRLAIAEMDNTQLKASLREQQILVKKLSDENAKLKKRKPGEGEEVERAKALGDEGYIPGVNAKARINQGTVALSDAQRMSRARGSTVVVAPLTGAAAARHAQKNPQDGYATLSSDED